jgi:hypothetical protein
MSKDNNKSIPLPEIDNTKRQPTLNAFVDEMLNGIDILYEDVKDLPIEYFAKGNMVDNRNELQYCLSSINDISRYLSDARKNQ